MNFWAELVTGSSRLDFYVDADHITMRIQEFFKGIITISG